MWVVKIIQGKRRREKDTNTEEYDEDQSAWKGARESKHRTRGDPGASVVKEAKRGVSREAD